jgi:hypothetical protein
MIATLSAVGRERLRRFLRILRIAALVGAAYAGATAGPEQKAALVDGVSAPAAGRP